MDPRDCLVLDSKLIQASEDDMIPFKALGELLAKIHAPSWNRLTLQNNHPHFKSLFSWTKVHQTFKPQKENKNINTFTKLPTH